MKNFWNSEDCLWQRK